MLVSINGKSHDKSQGATLGPINWPPSTTPKMMEAIVKPSIQPLALTNCEAGSNSVRMPYLAGEYAAAPRPTMAYAIKGWPPNNIIRQPTILMALLTSMTCPLGHASATAPTKGANNT